MDYPETEHPRFASALSALDKGDLAALTQILEDYPELTSAVSFSEHDCYAGYFYRPTLLHHVAGNPTRGPIPNNIVAIARLLLDRGADVDAFCGGGPTQPESGGGTVLGLAASGSALQEAGLSNQLIDLLIERGATMDFVGDGGLMWISLYHTVENKHQPEVAQHLYKGGHEIDLCFAVGLGLFDKVKEFFNKDDSLKDSAYQFYKHHCSKPAETDSEIIQDAFLFASISNQKEIGNFLLNKGAGINVFRPWGPYLVTPLHAAAWAGWADMAQHLLDTGADPNLKDPVHQSTPLEWARYCKREETASVIEKHEKGN